MNCPRCKAEMAVYAADWMDTDDVYWRCPNNHKSVMPYSDWIKLIRSCKTEDNVPDNYKVPGWGK